MATLRGWLEKFGFDFENGTIVYQPSRGYSPGWSSGDELEIPRVIGNDDPVLDLEFYSRYGSPQAPRIVAQDENKLYYISQYDGATWMGTMYRNVEDYCISGLETPYPGG